MGNGQKDVGSGFLGSPLEGATVQVEKASCSGTSFRDQGGRGLSIEHLQRVCVPSHRVTWVLVHLGRWRPREVHQQMHVEGVELGGMSRL